MGHKDSQFTRKSSIPGISEVRALIKGGMLQAAKEAAMSGLQRHRAGAEWLLLLADIEDKLGERARASQHLQQFLKQRPDHLAAISLHARILHWQGLSDEAIAACDRGLVLHPNDCGLRLQKATSQDQCHQYAAAWDTLQPLLIGSSIDAETASIVSRVLYSLERYDESLEWARRGTSNPRASAAALRSLWMHTGKIHDVMGRYDDAWNACAAAHQTVQSSFSPPESKKYFAALISLFSPHNLPGLARAHNDSPLPVFVIGMPRSGTSLVEQIIASHPLAFGAGEINDIVAISRSITAQADSMYIYPDSLTDVTPELADRLAERYLAQLREIGPQALRVTNKMLEQYEHVGLIWMLLPGARIIHVQRDPLDTCLSCYTRHLNPQRVPYATNLEHLGFVYRQHERLMEHWKATLDLPWLTVKYEDLVAEQDRVTRQIIGFLDLPWDDRCLRYWEADRTVMTLSYDQVNQPMYDSSIGRWRNYQKHLGPLRKALDLGE